MAEIYMDEQTGVGVLDFGPSAKGVTEVYSLGALVGDEALLAALMTRYYEVVDAGGTSLKLGFRTSVRLRFWVSFREGAVDGDSEFTTRVAERGIEKALWRFLPM